MVENTNLNKVNEVTKDDFSVFDNSEIENKLEYKIEEQKKIIRKLDEILHGAKEPSERKRQYFAIIDSNIKTLEDKKQEFSEINNTLTSLLLSAEENNDVSEQFNSIKQNITEYYKQLNEIINNIDNVTKEIMEFLEDPKYSESEQHEKNRSIEFINEEEIPESNVLTISEKLDKVLLPYKKSELTEYLRQYPNKYESFEQIINEEFTYPLSYYSRYSTLARFREVYSLIHDREGKGVFEALKLALDFMFKYELNPAIIAACKTQQQLENYLECAQSGNMENFKEFTIIFDVMPAKVKK